MSELRIERELKKASKRLGRPFYEKYFALKDRIFANKHIFSSAYFKDDNAQNLGHITRVMEYLDRLLGEAPISEKKLNPYELFLTMVSILYHDVSVLRQRPDHKKYSALFLRNNSYDQISRPADKAISAPPVVNNGSSKELKLDSETLLYKQMLVEEDAVRPAVVAALIRFADELDEDYRRAAESSTIKLKDESSFLRQFRQRINEIRPDPLSHKIFIKLQLNSQDLTSRVTIKAKQHPFISALAEKFAAINQERESVNRYLPDELQYREIVLSISPVLNWDEARDFIFTDKTTASDLLAIFPKLTKMKLTDSKP